MKIFKPFVGCAAIVLTTIATPALAQTVGTNFAEKHPPLTTKICRKVSTKLCDSQLTETNPTNQATPAGQPDQVDKVTQNNDTDDAYPVDQKESSNCVTEQTSVVVDGDQRVINKVGTKTRCFKDGDWNTSVCSSPTECSKICGLEGSNYENVKTSGDELTLLLTPETGPRVYLLDPSGTKYQQFYLLNQEFSFDVDVHDLPCGSNGALYFVKMDPDGGTSRYPGNTAGAKLGTGYCDAQCQKGFQFVDGEANMNKTIGSCCSEMDIWEANRMATAIASHACSVSVQTKCTADKDCGATKATKYSGWCDKPGCSYNPFRMGNKNFYGPGKDFEIDTTRPFTVITQFVTHDNTATGELVEIRRLYKQDGRVVKNPDSTWKGMNGTSSLTDTMCSTTKTVFKKHPYKMGDLAELGRQMIGGMTLTMSFWADYGKNMSWLDSYDNEEDDPTMVGGLSGPCPNPGGHPKQVFAECAHPKVKFSNIRTGDFGTTY